MNDRDKEKFLKCLTNSLKQEENSSAVGEELIDFRQMEVKFLCLGHGLESKCLYKDLSSPGACRMQVDRISHFECLRRV